MRKFGFMQVLKGLEANCYMSLGFERFLMEKVCFAMVLEGLDAKEYQSFQTFTFHYQIDAP